MKMQPSVFKPVPSSDKPYLVQHTTGFGDQGGEPITYKEYVGEFDRWSEAVEFGMKKYPISPSGWTYDHFDVVVNTLTKKGAKEFKDYEREAKIRWNAIKEDQKLYPEKYHTFEMENGATITLVHNPIFDEPLKLSNPQIFIPCSHQS